MKNKKFTVIYDTYIAGRVSVKATCKQVVKILKIGQRIDQQCLLLDQGDPDSCQDWSDWANQVRKLDRDFLNDSLFLLDKPLPADLQDVKISRKDGKLIMQRSY